MTQSRSLKKNLRTDTPKQSATPSFFHATSRQIRGSEKFYINAMETTESLFDAAIKLSESADRYIDKGWRVIVPGRKQQEFDAMMRKSNLNRQSRKAGPS